MKIKHIIYIIFSCILVISFTGCDDNENNSRETGHEGILDRLSAEVNTMTQTLWSTSPLKHDTKRNDAFKQIQAYADKCLSSYFSIYLNSTEQTSLNMEKADPILVYYRSAFDRVLEELKNTTAENGTSHIWQLYNMGYIVKTPSGCFGIDISHRWAKELAPYMDFLCVSHNHQDHYSTELINEMMALGKPVISNYLQNDSYPYTSKTPADYSIGKFKIHTSITDHNNSGLSDFVSVFYIECGDDSGDFSLIHTGDSNFRAEQFTNIGSHVSVLIPRYAPNALTENNIIGTGTGQTTPEYVLLSHILELAHSDTDSSRWSLEMALERASKINCEQTYVPMWGEKLTWKNGKLN